MLKNIVYIATITSLLFACSPKKVNYATISGKITNHLGKNGSIKARGYEKEITINEDGTFKDTLHLKEIGQVMSFSDGNENTSLFLKNGDNIVLTLDTKEFDETVTFTGNGAINNNYIAKKSLLSETLFTSSLFDAEKDDFNKQVKSITTKFEDLLANTKGLDTTLVNLETKGNERLEKQLTQQYSMMQNRKKTFEHLTGKASPEFVNYENINGTKTSLKNLKGKNVYIDVWATWCGPCLAEVPALKELEKEYHNKNIAFVSISVDNGSGFKGNDPKLAKEGWKKMIADKELKGIQLYADKNWKSDFIKAYKINSIPRFILIGKDGNIIDADAPRPSSPKIKEIFNNLK